MELLLKLLAKKLLASFSFIEVITFKIIVKILNIISDENFMPNNLKNYHFKIWVPLLFLLLALVPIFITSGFVLIAKISGILCLFSLLIALWYWKVVAKNLNSKTVPVSINLNDAYFLERNLLCYKSLNSSDKKTFNSRMGLFLAEIKAQNTSSAIISKEDWLSLASIIVILFWDKDYSSFSGYTFIWGVSEQNIGRIIYIDRDNLITFFNSLSKIDMQSCCVEIKLSNKLSFIKNLLVS